MMARIRRSILRMRRLARALVWGLTSWTSSATTSASVFAIFAEVDDGLLVTGQISNVSKRVRRLGPRVRSGVTLSLYLSSGPNRNQ